MQWQHGDLILTNKATTTSLECTFRLLQTTYWAHTRSLDTVEIALANSLCFFLMHGNEQVGFGRAISDFATTTWIADVVIAPSLRRRGVGAWMMKCILDHPKIKDTQFALQTGSAQLFYERLGFSQNGSLMSTGVDYLP